MYKSHIDSDQYESRSELFIPITFLVIEQVLPRLVSAMTASEPIISIEPRSADDVESAKINETFIQYQLLEQNIETKLYTVLKDALIYGTGIMKTQWGIEQETLNGNTVEKYRGPVLNYVNPFEFYPDPHATSLDDARYVIHRMFVTRETLEEWEQQAKAGPDAGGEPISKIRGDHVGGSQVDEEKQKLLQSVGKETVQNDNTSDWIEVIEYWENDRVMAVANESTVIRNEENPYEHAELPFTLFRDYPQGNEFFGQGEVENIKDLQHEVNAKRNQRIDNANLALNTILLLNQAAGIDSEELQVEPGAVWEVTSQDDIGAFQIPEFGGVSVREEQLAIENIFQTTSVQDVIRGSAGDAFPETATGVNAVFESAMTRFALKIRLIEESLQRIAKQMTQLNNQFMTREQTIRITGDISKFIPQEMVDTSTGPYKFLRFSPSDIAGNFDYIPKGGAAVTNNARQQRLIQLLQVIQPIASEVNVKELMRRIMESFEIKDVERILNPPEEQLERMQRLGNVSGQQSGSPGGQGGRALLQRLLGPQASGGSSGAQTPEQSDQELNSARQGAVQ